MEESHDKPKQRNRLVPREIRPRDAKFDETLLKCMPQLRKRAMYLMGNNEANAKDLLQNTFHHALRDSGTFRDNPDNEDAMRAWTYTVLMNTFRDSDRHSKRGLEDTGTEEDIIEAAGPESRKSPEESLDAHRILGKISAVFPTLPKREAEALGYAAVENRVADIANEMGVVPGTVKTASSRARDYIYDGLTPDERDVLTDIGIPKRKGPEERTTNRKRKPLANQ
ncbi:MAG: RNA polymerase sigma factor [bacterium]|nr:RNA polymerase sigma factor [bacterium]